MRNNSILFIQLSKALFCSMFFLYSCDNYENVVNHTNDPLVVDSNIFEWDFDTIYTDQGGMYVSDTNDIFLPGYPYSIFFNNGVKRYINHNDYDFVAECANGTSTTNIYIGGGSNSNYCSRLKKWKGNGIENIEMPLDTSNRITRIEIISENDIWISTLRNIIYHYSNQTFTTYKLDSGLVAGLVFKDKNNNIYAQYVKFAQGEYDYLYMYKYSNNSWLFILKDSISDNSEIGDYIGFSNGDILRSGKSSIYYFTGNIWEKYLILGNNLRPIFAAGGGSRNNIMFRASSNNSQDFIYYYNGSIIFRIPFYYFPYPSVKEVCFKYNRFYVSINYDLQLNYFGIAKLN